MDEKYDVVVLGTGLKECILSGLMSLDGKKVLHMDKNSYYGGESASLTPLSQLFKHFGKPLDADDKYGRGRDWNVDLIPKFLMANGNLVKLLILTGVTKYLEFKSLDGSYVRKGDGKLYKVPANEKEALSSSLMGIFEKRRFKSLLSHCECMDLDHPEKDSKINPETNSCEELYKCHGVDKNTQDFTGHAIGLYLNDEYLKAPCKDLIQRVRLYSGSLQRYGKSPYLYPLYGLGELPQGFARLSAIYGGTYMLAKKMDEIVTENGKVTGVRCGEEVVKTDMVICDPTYVPDRVKKVGQVVRAICILKGKVQGVNDCETLQIIIPQNQVGRKNDIYIGVLSNQLLVTAKGFYMAIVSTIVETSNPEQELQIGIDILSKDAAKGESNIAEKFVSVTDLLEPVEDGRADNVFISTSYDATSHFQTTCEDVLDIYRRITGNDLDLNKKLDQIRDDEQQAC